MYVCMRAVHNMHTDAHAKADHVPAALAAEPRRSAPTQHLPELRSGYSHFFKLSSLLLSFFFVTTASSYHAPNSCWEPAPFRQSAI